MTIDLLPLRSPVILGGAARSSHSSSRAAALRRSCSCSVGCAACPLARAPVSCGKRPRREGRASRSQGVVIADEATAHGEFSPLAPQIVPSDLMGAAKVARL